MGLFKRCKDKICLFRKLLSVSVWEEGCAHLSPGFNYSICSSFATFWLVSVACHFCKLTSCGQAQRYKLIVWERLVYLSAWESGVFHRWRTNSSAWIVNLIIQYCHNLLSTETFLLQPRSCTWVACLLFEKTAWFMGWTTPYPRLKCPAWKQMPSSASI